MDDQAKQQLFQLLDGQLHTPGIKVADQQFDASGMQRFGQGEADIAQALNGDPQSFQIVAAKTRLGRGANAREYTQCCVR